MLDSKIDANIFDFWLCIIFLEKSQNIEETNVFEKEMNDDWRQ